MDRPRPWWFSKKNEPAVEYDEDYDSLYYGKKDPDEETVSENAVNEEGVENAYVNVEDTSVSEVKVAWSEESAKPVAKAAEPLMKKTFTPRTCQDSPAIVDSYKDGRVVIICVEELNKDHFHRLFDYVMGAVHGLDGELRRLDRDTVVLLPFGVEEDIDIDSLEEVVESDSAEADVK